MAKSASVALLLAGLGAVAYSGWPHNVAPETSVLEATAPAQFEIPTEDDGYSDYVPPFALLDRNGDGAISNEEYLRYLAGLRDEAIERVLASRLPDASKSLYVSRLRSNYDKEAGCVTRLANRDRQSRGSVSKDRFALFHSMITEFCTVDDVSIPPEFKPTTAPLPENREDDSTADTPTLPPRAPTTSAPLPPAQPNPTLQPPPVTQPPVPPLPPVMVPPTVTEPPARPPPPVPVPIPAPTPAPIPRNGQSVKCVGGDDSVFRFVDGAIRRYPNADVASMWDPVWFDTISIDCTRVARGSDMPPVLPAPINLAEGQAIKCDASDAAVFRFASGQRRLYPSPAIASSWDSSWPKAVAVDCTTIPRGDDMGHNPAGFSEGQAIKCGDQATYRFTEGSIRLYPSEAVATSWDPNWRNSVAADCGAFARGPDMALRFAAVSNLPEGQAVKCDASSAEVFRLASGERRLYPSVLVAASWDSNWAAAAIIDCSFVPRGEDMGFNVGAIAEGRAVKCLFPESGAIYRFSEGMIRFYPSPEIASSWDPTYASPQLIDCSRIARGSDMPLRPAVVAALPEGQAIKCDPVQAEVFRYASGQRRLYPNPLIAGSWDRAWASPVILDCSAIPRGEDMPFNFASIPNGRAVKCGPTEGAIFRFVEGVIRHYPSPAIAGSWDPNWANPLVIDCTRVARGSDMADRTALSQRYLVEGQSIRCHPLDPAVYRLADGELRLYPSVEVAASWDANWANPVLLDCTGIPRGPDLEMRLWSPGVLAEGQPVKCGPRNDEVYRHTGGMLRWYPSVAIAASWDSNWARWTIIDCTSLPRGPDMALKVPFLANGQSVKCDRSEAAVYRYADGQIRLYPSPDIATSWDPSWGSAIVIDCSRIPRGPDLPAKLAVPARLAEGQPIKCGVRNDEVYRYSGGQRRWYPSPDIASSWDPNWSKWTVVDCSTIPRGSDMPRRQLMLAEGQSVKCVGDNVAVYRFSAGALRLYPSPAIASSWDPNWGSALVIDCSQMPRGPDLALKLPPPTRLVEGQSIRCGWDNMEVYRYTGGQRRWYPSEVIASSWDLSWGKWTIVDCASIPRAVDMPLRAAPPAGDIVEGQTISCRGERERYRFASGQRRLYPSPEIAASWDANLANFLVVDCSALPQGPDMPFNQIALLEGQTVNCKKGDIPIFRFANGQIRFYPSPAIASSWDPFWGNPVTIDCTKVPRGPDMALRVSPLESLSEGQAIKCDAAQSEVYRFASGQRRWYPSPAIAASWDREWSKPLVVDCTAIARGPDMALKQPVLVDGQTVNCNPGDVPIYRFSDGKIRFYPSPAIANSWDVFWGNPTTVDCTKLARGPDMALRVSPLEKLAEGQSIKCDASQVEVYRFASGQRRLFPSAEAASSWDPEWTQAPVVDCSAIPRGPDMAVRQPFLVEGQTVNCKAGDIPIYRFAEGKIRFYPNPAIASSWDPFWGSPVTIDCSKVQKGPDMVLRLSPLARLVEGQSIKCDPNQVEVYRFASGQRRLFLSVAMAASWDPNWRQAAVVDCGAIPRGPDMAMFTPPPANVREGRAIKCAANQVEVYRYTSGVRRLYPSSAVATSWDMTWPTSAVIVNCNSIPQGEIMPWNIGLIPEGQAVRCSPSDSAIYRIQDGRLRWFPSAESATSWDYMWGSAIVIDCSRLPRGADMPVKITPIAKLQEGQSIKCGDRAPEVFRYTSGLRRFYPSPSIATSWDANWPNVVIVDCGSLPRGDDMAYNLGNLAEGQTVKCTNSPSDLTVYRVTEGKIRLYPSVESATSWDFMWASALTIDCNNLPRGPDMTVRTSALASLKEGQAIKCAPNQPAVFRFTSGVRRLYPSPVIATSWDITWASAITVDCTTVPRSDDMAYNVGNLVDGQAVKCADGAVYRFTDGQLRLYPSAEAASSWDRLWFSSIPIDCTDGLPEGQAIKCDPEEAAVFRLTGGQRRWYPNPEIASSWDPQWASFKVVDCSTLPRGDDMPLNNAGWRQCG
ncbi:hypothetical protein ATCC90586_005021 [Pythium insidiosum]|nr:hypothetical protein ATCC90586_005021 [Pythium insidiosum]